MAAISQLRRNIDTNVAANSPNYYHCCYKPKSLSIGEAKKLCISKNTTKNGLPGLGARINTFECVSSHLACTQCPQSGHHFHSFIHSFHGSGGGGIKQANVCDLAVAAMAAMAAAVCFDCFMVPSPFGDLVLAFLCILALSNNGEHWRPCNVILYNGQSSQWLLLLLPLQSLSNNGLKLLAP